MSLYQSAFSRINGLLYTSNYRQRLVNRISSTAFQYSPKLTIEEKLGIKPRPKRPHSPFLKFIGLTRTSVVQQNPQANSKEIIKLLAEEWKKVDESLKLQLQEDYNKEWLQYTEDCKKYDKQLSPVERDEITKAKQEAKTAKEKKKLKKHREELGCPKKPGSSFLLFMNSKLPERGEAPFKEFQKKVKEDWDKLPELQKDRFEKLYQKEMEEYRTKMTLWMKKMDEEGHLVTKQKEKSEGPKKPPSSYIYFMKTKLLERGDIPFREYQKKIREDWEKLSPEEKKTYDDKYKQEMEEYKQKLVEEKSHSKTKAQGVRKQMS